MKSLIILQVKKNQESEITQIADGVTVNVIVIRDIHKIIPEFLLYF